MISVRRRQLIEQRLRAGPAQSQEEIARVLRSHGIRTTQATVSRDLVALGALKGPQGYVLPDDGARVEDLSGALERAMSEHALSVIAADSIVVIRTGPGRANLLGVAIDRRAPEGVVGCLAGDDTLFLATTSRAAAQRLASRLSRLAGSR